MRRPGQDVLVDARMWGHPGIGRYIRELAGSLGAGEEGARIGYILPSGTAPPGGAVGLVSDCAIYGWREQWAMPRLSASWKLLHVPHFNVPVLRRAPIVVTIHDLIYVTEPGAAPSAAARFYADALIATAVRRARVVIAVSEATRQEVLRRYRIQGHRVRVVQEAASEVFSAAAQPVVDGRPYVLFVGTLKAHKNPLMLVEALDRVRRRSRLDVTLVVAGKKDPRQKALSEKVLAADFVRYAGAVSDGELARLYRGAQALVLPSFKEGFGLPALEAMACGTPVLLSDRSSLPEVGGEAALYFDPTQIDALERLLYNVLTDANTRKDLSEKGIRRARAFSWQRAARQTLDVYKDALK